MHAICHVTELRKERSERAVGGVNPGEESYYAAAARGQVNAPPMPYSDYSSHEPVQRPVVQQQPQPQQHALQPPPRASLGHSNSRGRQHGLPGAVAGGAEAGILQEWSSPEVGP